MPGSARTRTFDQVLVGNRETDAWAAYYRREWRGFLVAAVGLVSAGFGMRPHRNVVGAWHVLRANQLWSPYPDNDPGNDPDAPGARCGGSTRWCWATAT